MPTFDADAEVPDELLHDESQGQGITFAAPVDVIEDSGLTFIVPQTPLVPGQALLTEVPDGGPGLKPGVIVTAKWPPTGTPT